MELLFVHGQPDEFCLGFSLEHGRPERLPFLRIRDGQTGAGDSSRSDLLFGEPFADLICGYRHRSRR